MPRTQNFGQALPCGLAGANEGEGDALLTGPGVEDPAGEFRAIVDDDDLGFAAQFDEAFEDAHDPCAGQGDIDLEGEAFAGEVIDDVEGPEGPAAGEGVGGEVHGPAGIGATCGWFRDPWLCDTLLALAAANGEVLELAEAVELLVVHPVAFPFQQDAQPPVPEARPCGGVMAQALPDGLQGWPP
jgi:hypothetical protein